MAYLARGRRARVARMEASAPPRPPGGPTIGDMPHADIIVRLVAILLDPDASPEEQSLAALKSYTLTPDFRGDLVAVRDDVAAAESRPLLRPDAEWRAAVDSLIAD